MPLVRRLDDAARVAAFGVAYVLFAAAGPAIGVLLVAFVLAGGGTGCAETAEHAAVAALAPTELRGSAFGLLASVRAAGSVTASVVAGLVYPVVSPAAAFGYPAARMLLALGLLGQALGSRARRA